LPIVFLSAVYSDDFHVFKGYEAGRSISSPSLYNPASCSAKSRSFYSSISRKGSCWKKLSWSDPGLPGKHFAVHDRISHGVSAGDDHPDGNGACMALLGYRQDESSACLSSTSWQRRLFRMGSRAGNLPDTRVQQSGAWFKSKSGERNPGFALGAAFRDSVGVIPGAVLVARDIRERKAAEEACQERSQISRLVENAPALFYG